MRLLEHKRALKYWRMARVVAWVELLYQPGKWVLPVIQNSRQTVFDLDKHLSKIWISLKKGTHHHRRSKIADHLFKLYACLSYHGQPNQQFFLSAVAMKQGLPCSQKQHVQSTPMFLCKFFELGSQLR